MIPACYPSNQIEIHRLKENLMWSCLFEDITEMDKADTELALERQEVAEEVIEALHLDADEPVLTTSMSENELDLNQELDINLSLELSSTTL